MSIAADTAARPRATPLAGATPIFAAAGVLSVAVMVSVLGAWILSGDARPTPTGSDPVPFWTSVWAVAWQVTGVLAIAVCAVYLVVRSRREGRLTFDALLFIAWTVAIWLDPATNNLFRPQLAYNAALVNLGSWAPHIPGWST